MHELIIDTEFQNLIPKLTTEEYDSLEQNLLSHGCLDALKVWNDIIIDGHNRYELCQKHGIEFDTKEMEFDSREDAKIWIIKNQLSRRNLSPFVKIELKLKSDEIQGILDKAKENQIRKPISVLLTSVKQIEPINATKEIAKATDTSIDAVVKAKKIIEQSSPEIIQSIRDGELTINKVYKDIKREEKQQEIRDQTFQPTIPDGLFDVIYADPPWRYEFAESNNREIENQYPTMPLDDIKNLKIPSADNAVLLLWATSPKLEEAMQVLNEWGFSYRTCAVWDKQIIGMGYWFRQQHEILLLGVKGNPKCPEVENRFSSVFSEKRGVHSKKPEHYYQMIESMFPNKRYIELFARQTKEGWAMYSNEK